MAEQASEKAKVAEAERVLAEQLKAWERKMKKEDGAAQRTWRDTVGMPKAFNPFEGAPLSPLFPKTPMNFYKGEAVVATNKVEKVEEASPKSFNPFEGAPLSPQFPKTPLKFYKGQVVGEPEVVVTDHDAKKAPGTVDEGRGEQSNDT